MAKWLEQASRRHEMYCHDLEFESQSAKYLVKGYRRALTGPTTAPNSFVSVRRRVLQGP